MSVGFTRPADSNNRQAAHRIAVYLPTAFSPGTLRRLSALARAVRETEPETGLLLLTDSPPSAPLPPAVELAQVEPRNRDGLLQRIVGASLDPSELWEKRSTQLLRALTDYDPHVLLVDDSPIGVDGELLPALAALKQRAFACRIVLGLRDVLDAPQSQVQQWQGKGAYDALSRFYDGILVYGVREVFDTGMAYRLPALRSGIRYCGYVVDDAPDAAVHPPIRAYVWAGGGAAGEALLRASIDALRLLQAESAILVTGPGYSASARLKLHAQARDLPIQIETSVTNPLAAMSSAEVIISTAGYSAVAEVLRSRKPAILVPRNDAEETLRTTILVDRGLVDALFPTQISDVTLANRVSIAWQEAKARPRPSIPTEGARVAAAALMGRAEPAANISA